MVNGTERFSSNRGHSQPPSYLACAWTASKQPSAIASFRSTMTVSTPHVAIRSLTLLMSDSSGWPRSALKASTSKPSSTRRLHTVLESRPPDTHTPTFLPLRFLYEVADAMISASGYFAVFPASLRPTLREVHPRRSEPKRGVEVRG